MTRLRLMATSSVGLVARSHPSRSRDDALEPAQLDSRRDVLGPHGLDAGQRAAQVLAVAVAEDGRDDRVVALLERDLDRPDQVRARADPEREAELARQA